MLSKWAQRDQEIQFVDMAKQKNPLNLPLVVIWILKAEVAVLAHIQVIVFIHSFVTSHFTKLYFNLSSSYKKNCFLFIK